MAQEDIINLLLKQLKTQVDEEIKIQTKQIANMLGLRPDTVTKNFSKVKKWNENQEHPLFTITETRVSKERWYKVEKCQE